MLKSKQRCFEISQLGFSFTLLTFHCRGVNTATILATLNRAKNLIPALKNDITLCREFKYNLDSVFS